MLGQAFRTVGFILEHPVGRRRRLLCLGRFASWQLRSRLVQGSRLVPFVSGTQLWASRGETGITGNIYVGLHEFAEMGFVAHYLRPGDLFADIGANAGSYTIIASGIAGARTIAVEPVPETIVRLKNNIGANRIEHLVRIAPCAVGAQEGEVRFSVDLDTVNHVVTDDEIAHIRVALRTIDHLFEHERPALIKLDVEGYDREALSGARQVLADTRLQALVVELSNRSSARSIMDAGFTACRYDPFTRELTEADALMGSGNTIFVRDMGHVRGRLEEGAKIEVMGLHV
jgi:FkbM family methyltransferase